ncbi:MAG TPA: hypothetical protein ACFYED_09045 [Candidatus Tripitaka californicus]|uniref:hypothetical protein n=1 Tax=Candidatus Tripitaka californicus TaxID=3367616 RepID=UPI004026A450|nr:hypothetical protein [Planctomycetota bacterium]
MRNCEGRILEELEGLIRQTSGVAEKVARLEEKVSHLEDLIAVFLRDHNDLVALKTRWHVVLGMAGFFGAAFTTLLAWYLRVHHG